MEQTNKRLYNKNKSHRNKKHCCNNKNNKDKQKHIIVCHMEKIPTAPMTIKILNRMPKGANRAAAKITLGTTTRKQKERLQAK